MKKNNKSKSKSLDNALMAFRHSMTSALVEEARKQGCSLSHFEVVKYIGGKGSPSMKNIADQLEITPPSASALVDTLERKHLVTRSYISEDRRTVRVLLAPKGQVLLSSVYRKKSSIFNKMLTSLNQEDKNTLARILTKCI